MDSNRIIKVAYETIRDALEWGCDKNNGEMFANYVWDNKKELLKDV